VFRVLISLAVLALLLWSCGPDSPSTCSEGDPDFKVVLKLAARPLPPDTVVHVTYAGAGTEDFRLSDRNARQEVAFCLVADELGVPLAKGAPQPMNDAEAAGAAGAAGPSGDAPEQVLALYCEFYTAGFTRLKVSGSGFTTVDYQLAKKSCTVNKEFVLDLPDAGGVHP
jgi:hypothetical protein